MRPWAPVFLALAASACSNAPVRIESRALADQVRAIRVPSHVVAAIANVNRATHDLQQERGREPRLVEVADRLGLSLEHVQMTLRSVSQTVSLEAPVGSDDSNRMLKDLIEDHRWWPRSALERSATS